MSRRYLVEAASAAIVEGTIHFPSHWNAGLILRSSAVNESLADRGAYDSKSVAADFDIEAIVRSLQESFEQFYCVSPGDQLAIVVQPLVPGPNRYIGHISNERRVSKTINQWMLECPAVDWAARFNSQRSVSADITQPLTAANIKELTRTFKAVGRWCTKLNYGPCHIEWAWSNRQLWLLQLDLEDESPDDGVDPRLLIRPADSEIITVSEGLTLNRVDLHGPLAGWDKIDKIRELASVRTQKFPELYYVRADEIVESDVLISGIQEMSNGRVVCRTDCSSEKIERLNLPRTHSVSPHRAVQFMNETTAQLIERGARKSEICFILHRFIPAAASAWVIADPNSQIVRVDSLWGIPDGLQFLPHDTFEFDIKRGKISSEIIRYKVSFIQEIADGSWKEIRIARRHGRSRSLSSSSVSEVAQKTHQIAKGLGRRTQVMWFCEIPGSLKIGQNLPWFRMTAPDIEANVPRTLAPTRERFRIRTNTDLNNAGALNHDRYVLVVQPNVELIRDDDLFLHKLAEIAIRIGAPVELYGSILGHAYYMLRRAGVTVIALGEPHRSRTRGRQKCVKLVRDEIPHQIEQHGETTILAHIPRQEARAALVVKLFEEAHELLRAVNPADVEGELADLLEVVRSLASATGISWDDVQSRTDTKRSQRGGFDKGVILMETAWPKLHERKIHDDNVVPLKNLGQIKQSNSGIEMNFAALLARGGTNRFTSSDGTIYEISLTGFGISLKRIESKATSEQPKLPGFDE